MKEPAGIQKIKASIKDAKSKGYSLALCKGAFKSFVEAKHLEALPYDEQLEKFNRYLNKFNLACVSTRKGILFGFKNEVKQDYHSNNGFEW